MFRSAKKTDMVALSEKYYYVEFSLLEDLGTEPRPLQFINIWIPGVDEVPMSISQYTVEKLYVLFKVVGEGTRSLRDRSGFFGIKGPLGNGISLSSYSRVLFVAGGTGIAPLPFLAKHAEESGVSLDVVWGVKKSSDLFNVKRLVPSTSSIYYASEDCVVGYCGRASDLAKWVLHEHAWRYDVVVCVGPKDMLLDMCRKVGGLAEVFVSLEALVKCGLGACGSCILKPLPRLLCIDGPVFKCSEVYKHLEWSTQY